ncbi:MAG: regulatory protein RecX [Lachnospiraceae bacterium]|nr:regulatory protein RecX [Lachnospiraceae bacterium]
MNRRIPVSQEEKTEEWTEEQDAVLRNEMERKARLRCMKLLEYSDRTEQQLRKKLQENEFPAFAVESAISYVKQFHYLDDRRYAENYLLQQGQRKSRKRMAQDLRQRGVSNALIEEAIDNSSDCEAETAAKLLEKRARGKDLSQDKVRWGLVRYLTGRGFSYDLSRRLVASYTDSSMEEDWNC